MPSAGTSLDLNMHDVMKRGEITMTVNVHQDWRVRLGLWIAAIGLRITGLGIKLEDEADG